MLSLHLNHTIRRCTNHLLRGRFAFTAPPAPPPSTHGPAAASLQLLMSTEATSNPFQSSPLLPSLLGFFGDKTRWHRGSMSKRCGERELTNESWATATPTSVQVRPRQALARIADRLIYSAVLNAKHAGHVNVLHSSHYVMCKKGSSQIVHIVGPESGKAIKGPAHSSDGKGSSVSPRESASLSTLSAAVSAYVGTVPDGSPREVCK